MSAVARDATAELTSELVRLETLLLDPAFRRDREKVAALLAEDFREFGSSGRVYDKAGVLDLLAAEPSAPKLQAADFVVAMLAPEAALVTYRSTRAGASALRSSIWTRSEAGWEIRFHQGTRSA